MNVDDKVLKRFKQRRAALTAYIDHPDREHVRKEQKHTIKVTEERIYWHFGYVMCLRDMILLIEKGISTKAEDEPLVP